MAYGLKYYKNIPQADGSIIRLEIHKYTEGNIAPVAMEIGAVIRGLHLDIQGQTDEVDSPIVKTSLTMTFCDAPDLQGGDILKKCGGWEEFYTASATEWKVLLKEKSPHTNLYSTIWGGYITPDSFSEELTYHGSVTLIARDNLGHLQDFPFDAGDADGMVSLYTIVASALAKIESPMDYDFFGDGGNSANDVTHWLKCKDKPLYDARMNVSFFEGMNYYEALEKALYALGCVMRYVGRNRVYVCPLRDMPKHGYHDYDYFATIEPVLINGATRELVPACKMIEEVDDYEIEDAEQPLVKAEDFSGDAYEVDNTSHPNSPAPVHSLKNKTGYGWANSDPTKPMFFNPVGYPVKPPAWYPSYEVNEEEVRNTMWLFAQSTTARAEYVLWAVAPCDFAFAMEFGRPIDVRTPLGIIGETFDVPYIEVADWYGYKLHSMKYAVKAYCNGVTQYLNAEGKWQSAFTELTATADNNTIKAEIPLSLMEAEADVTLIITGFNATTMDCGYISLKSFKIQASEGRSYCESKTIKTIYNESNNVVLTRDPELAPAQDIVSVPAIIKNGIFVDYALTKFPAKDWETSEGYVAELPVHIHKQLLCYYSKPNNLINGTIVNSGTMGLSCNWLWRGKEHILMSGSLNLLNGHMEGAVLREFTRYEDMWDDSTGEAMGNTPQIKPENPPIIG